MNVLMFNQILWTSSVWNLRRPVKRIRMFMLKEKQYNYEFVAVL